jgi:hypothetical protein
MKTISVLILLIVIKLNMMANSGKTLSTEVIIEASAEQVWIEITEIANWEKWNPFIIKSVGTIAKGEKLQNTHVMGDKTVVFKPRVIEFEEGKSYSWIGRLIMPGIVDGKHSFEVVPMGDGKVKLLHYEKFSGILSGMMVKKYGDETLEYFKQMNAALKVWVESKYNSSN